MPLSNQASGEAAKHETEAATAKKQTEAKPVVDPKAQAKGKISI